MFARFFKKRHYYYCVHYEIGTKRMRTLIDIDAPASMSDILEYLHKVHLPDKKVLIFCIGELSAESYKTLGEDWNVGTIKNQNY